MPFPKIGARLLAGFWLVAVPLPAVLPQQASAGPVDAVKQVQTTGLVRAVDPASHRVLITHEPVRELGLPAMTTSFRVHASLPLVTLRPGQRVLFTLDEKHIITALDVQPEPAAIPLSPEP